MAGSLLEQCAINDEAVEVVKKRSILKNILIMLSQIHFVLYLYVRGGNLQNCKAAIPEFFSIEQSIKVIKI